jgi:hypothetical protein
MEGMDGLEPMDRLKESHPALPFVVITAAGAIAKAVDSVKRAAFQYMVKPCDAEDLRKVVTEALHRGRRQPTEASPLAYRPPTASFVRRPGATGSTRAPRHSPRRGRASAFPGIPPHCEGRPVCTAARSATDPFRNDRSALPALGVGSAAVGRSGKTTLSLERWKAPWAGPPSRLVGVDGMSVHYQDDGSGPAIVLLHGNGASLHTWTHGPRRFRRRIAS